MASGGPKTGAAFCISNIGVEGGTSMFHHRKGAEKDQDNIQSVFIYRFGFELINKNNTTNFNKNDWDHKYNPGKSACANGSNCMVCLIRNTDYRSYEHVVFHISSDGYCDDGGGLAIQFLSDSVEEYVSLAEIVEAFSDTNCPGLKGKIRILIIQACRYDPRKPGEANDPGVDVFVDNESSMETEEAGNTQNNPVLMSDDEEPEVPNPVLPVHQVPGDFLIVFSTTPRRYAKRNITTGSWFEAELKNVVDAFLQGQSQGKDIDFLQVLTETASNVAKKESRSNNPIEYGKKNVPCFEHRLTKSIIFRCVP